jgi:2-polyprenyl-3-methyl-5-hydroxy-6-metoxy-1,4-benzoquinol methylase
MKITDQVMENTQAYRLWQAPFAEQKFAPVLAYNDLSRVRRVLDVGCGPGTNAHHFAGANYFGIDCNEKYIEYARKHYKGNFLVADVTRYRAASGERFDFILVNSLLHHIDAPSVCRILTHLSTLLTNDGHVHILDLVLPRHTSIALLLARMDRGKFPRPIDQWCEMFEGAFDPAVFEPYPLKAFGVSLWNMVYFKGRAKQ